MSEYKPQSAQSYLIVQTRKISKNFRFSFSPAPESGTKEQLKLLNPKAESVLNTRFA